MQSRDSQSRCWVTAAERKVPVYKVLLPGLLQRFNRTNDVFFGDVAARVSIALNLKSGCLQSAHSERVDIHRRRHQL